VLVAATIGGCTVQELGDRMSAEEFAWWSVMIDNEQIGPHHRARMLAHIAAGTRNGPLKGPDGDGSAWGVDHFIDPKRWAPPKREPTLAEMKRAIRAFFRSKIKR
jgi:hypothetical protein